MGNISSEPRVTWLLPVRNGMPYIEKTLASIQAQDYRNHDIIAWDNGSTDATLDTLCRWIPERIPGKVIGDRPLGLGASLAAMVNLASAPLCARIDADDLNEPNRLSMQVAFMCAHPDVAVVGSAVRYIDADDNLKPDRPTIVTHDADIRWRLRFCNAFNHPTVMFRRAAVMEVGNYRDVMPIEDFDLWVRLALRFELANLATPLVRYRVLPGSVSGTNHHRIDAIRRKITQDYAMNLFPDVQGAKLERLHQVLECTDESNVLLEDCRTLYRTATTAARQIGKRGDYFRTTSLFRTQMKSLAIRWLKVQPVIGHVWSTIRKRKAA